MIPFPGTDGRTDGWDGTGLSPVNDPIRSDPFRSVPTRRANYARTMFSVEPRDQSARTTTLRFACVIVEEEHVVVVSQSNQSESPSSYLCRVSHARSRSIDPFLSRTVRTPRDLLRPETAA